jgi:hypothetical protein
MEHLEGSGTPVLYIGRTVFKVPDTLFFITGTTNICRHITTDLITH